MWFTKKYSRPAPSHRRAFQPRLERLEDRRLLSAGALDTTFGSGGVVTTPIGTRGEAQAYGAAIYSSTDTTGNANKIVAAGYADDGNSGGSNIDFAVARYNPDGSLDTAFNGSGIVTTSFSSSDEAPFAIFGNALIN